jgi:hypothetical protein
MAANAATRFVICLDDRGCEDLQKGKVYVVVEDRAAAREKHLRVVDDSGEDYIYPASNFSFVSLPREAQEALLENRESAR